MKTCKLNKNENPFDFDKSIKKIILDKLSNLEWNRYAIQYDTELISKLADYSKVYKENVLIGPGAVYFLNLCIDIFGKKHTILPSPSFPFYEVLCKSNNCSFEFWNLNSEYEYDINNYPDIKPNTLTIICSPNNPTGTIIPESTMLALLEKYQQNIFVIDETYYEFHGFSFAKYINKYPNLIIIRSFSKVFASAGVRFGYLLASESLKSVISKKVLPYNINIFSQLFAYEILSNKDILKTILNKINFINTQKEIIFQNLSCYPLHFKIHKSEGNFLLLKFKNDDIYNTVINQLELNKISIAPFSGLRHLDNSFRMTVGSEYENQKFIRIIKSSLISL